MKCRETDEELARRAFAAFMEWGKRLPTGAMGLRRRDLKRLERMGYVKGQMARLDSGTLVHIWSWIEKI